MSLECFFRGRGGGEVRKSCLKVTLFSFLSMFFPGHGVKATYSDERREALLSNDRDSPTLTAGRAEENDEPEEKGDDSLTDDREDDARSPCLSRENSSDPGEAKANRLALHPKT